MRTWHLPALLARARLPLIGGCILLALAFTGLLAGSLAPPLIERVGALVGYLNGPPSSPNALDYATLSQEVRATVESGLAPSFAGRIIFHRIEDWSPHRLDNPETVPETVARLTDTAPILGPSWIGSKQLVDSYRTFLEELQRDVVVRNTALDASGTINSPNIFEILGRRFFAALRLGADAQAVSDSFRELEFASLPDPTRPSSRFPRAELSPPDLLNWLQGTDVPIPRRAVSTVRLVRDPSPPGSAASGPHGELVASDQNKPLRGDVTATLYSRDWRLFNLIRNYKPEVLMESHRSNINPYIRLDKFFGVGGSLSVVPYAIVVAKDVVFEVGFESLADFRSVSELLLARKPLTLLAGSTSIVIEPGAAMVSEGTQSISIAPTGVRSQVIGVVSLLY